MTIYADIQRALYAKLTADSTLRAAVYDEVPAQTQFPYIVLGETTALPFDSHTREGLELTHTLHIWSRYRGYLELYNIFARLHQSLHNATLELDGSGFVACRIEFTDVLRDPDGTRHGVMRLRIWANRTKSP